MQGDGNLVLYNSSSVAIWATSWAQAPAVAGNRFSMQADGNAVLYSSSWAALYSTCTTANAGCAHIPAGDGGAHLLLQNDGNLVVYNGSYSKALWTYAPDNMFTTANYSPTCNDFDLASSNRTFCRTDDAVLTWYAESSVESSTDRAVIQAVMSGQYAPTDLIVSESAAPSYTGSNETDIIYQEQSFTSGPNAIGTAWCDDATSSEICDQHYIRYWYGSDVVPSEALICHETGHAVGLTHGNNAGPKVGLNDHNLGCMGGSGNGLLGQRNTLTINSTY